jgi:glycosyltransferase involved in cell wall biosynthesis
MRVLYDGWSLVHDPLSPESLHLQAILDNLAPGITPVLVFPDRAPDWMDPFEVHVLPSPDTASGRLGWQQFRLPSLARQLDVHLQHLTAPTASTWSRLPTVFSPTGFGAGVVDWTGIPHRPLESAHVFDRLRLSSSQGGLVRVNRILWPGDLPDPGLAAPLGYLPPILPRNFVPGLRQLSNSDPAQPPADTPVLGFLQLPDDFILYHGPGGGWQLELLVQAWIWCAAAIGEYFPLLLLGLGDGDSRIVTGLIELYDLKDTVHILKRVTPVMLPRIYQQSTAVFHPAPASPWCGPVRLALASGKPLVAIENPQTAAITGPAAYLAEGKDARALGAALVTVVVDEDVAGSLSAAARTRVQDWVDQQFGEQLTAIYRDVCGLG